MEKIQQHNRIVKKNSDWKELFLYCYLVSKIIDIKNMEIKFVIVIQDIDEVIYDIKEEDFFGNDINSTNSINKNISEIAEFYDIDIKNRFLASEEFNYNSELCQECFKKWKKHLNIRTMKLREYLFDKWENNIVANGLISIYINTIQPKITTCIFNLDTQVIDYEILIIKHNCSDINCWINGKIIIKVTQFDYSWKKFNDKEKLIMEYSSNPKNIIYENEIDNYKNIEKELLEVINKLVSQKNMLIARWNWKEWDNSTIPKFEIDFNLWK